MKKKLGINAIISLISQIVISLFGLVIPRLVLLHYGSDVNGLTSTITQVFSYLALLEAGISQAAKNALYPYIKDKENNVTNINHILSISKQYYKKMTIIYGGIVLVLSIVLPFVIKTDVNWITIFFLVIIEGISGVVSFYFIQNWATILTVDGKTYFNSFSELLNKSIFYIVKIVLVLFNVNIIFIQVGSVIGILIKLLLYYVYIKRNYSWVKYEKTSEKLKDRNSYIITEIAWTIFSSTDIIVLSLFCSATLSSVYYVYSMIFNTLNLILNTIYQSVVYKLCQDYFADIDKYKITHDKFNIFFVSTINILMCVGYILIIPFVKLYTAGVDDVNYIYEYIPIFFSVIQLLSWSRYVSGNLTGLSGYAKQTSYISLLEAILNIILSIILVNFYGIYGVLIATVVALPLKVIFTNYISERKVLKRNPIRTITIYISNYIIFIATIIINKFFLKLQIDNYISFILYGIILTLIYTVIIYLINFLINIKILKKH